MRSALALLLLSIFCFSCQKEKVDCPSDIAVTALDAPATASTGATISVYCEIKNVSAADDSCVKTSISAQTSIAFSPVYSEDFSDYSIVQRWTADIQDLRVGQATPPERMEIPPSDAEGWYAIKVSVVTPGDFIPQNDSRISFIQVRQ